MPRTPKTTKKSSQLTLHDLLSHLSHSQACKLLGPDGAALIREGGAFPLDPGDDVQLTPAELHARLPDGAAEVRVRRSSQHRGRLEIACSVCSAPCAHAGAVLSLVLEEKVLLGLAAPPPERVPVESLSEAELVELALAQRAERAAKERMYVRSADPKRPYTDYTVTSAASGKTYRVALRGRGRGQSYCSCPDFRKNTLGTCKHILKIEKRAERTFSARVLARPYQRRDFSVHLHFGDSLELRLSAPTRPDPEAEKLAGPLLGRPITDLSALLKRIGRLERAGHEVRIYPDAEQYIQGQLLSARLQRVSAEIRKRPAEHPLREKLLKAPLLPYQLDGIAFAVGAGRAILADDMGLGKTIQGIGVAELLAREAGIKRVLVICPTSLKSQWHSEIDRFSNRDSQLVLGTAAERAEQYGGETFFTICNYEQVMRDLTAIEQTAWDLIVLDEGQRIKNWETKTARSVKGLRSRFALVLSGTPLENRLDELYSVVEFVDDRRLGPAFRFLNQHRVVDEKGRVLGYKELSALRERLAPILLRRTRGQVLEQLPPRTTRMIRIEPTAQQRELHDGQLTIVRSIVNKSYISEMDLLRLRKALLMCRLAANGTYLVTKEAPGYSTKLEELGLLLDRLAAEGERKVVLFSEWTTMLDLIEPMLAERGLRHVRLDGSVPQKKRADLVREFRQDPACGFFLATNAGATGLNLQVADTLINVDLPWNPAVLEQRIARIHRMGQKRPVQIHLLVTENTLEERLLSTLAAKQDLAMAALDVDSEVDVVQLVSSMEELRSRLEVLLGNAPEAPLDASEKQRVESEAERLAKKQRAQRVGEAAGQMLTGAFQLLQQALPEAPDTPATQELESRIRQSLFDCTERDEAGRLRLNIALPEPTSAGDGEPVVDALGLLARALTQLAAAQQPRA
ncbi:MAG: DEAD/DEAH box helicase [Myxococcales bacterium]|nr:DEAD/DEAH box helicase [Myxococcales bacterium]